jgi:predicted site-specific integrase-resolvase
MKSPKGINYENLKKFSQRGSLRVLTTNGKHDIIRACDLDRHIAAGYVVAIIP